MASNYKQNFDYSEAIANTTDSATRQQLLTERQNKIDAEGLNGKVASNEAVSTWNGSYRPYSVSSGGSSGGGSSHSSGHSSSNSIDLSALFQAAEQARLQRLQAAQQRIQSQLTSNLNAIEQDYTAGMKQTDINAQRSVISNEERMAALGLNMGARSAAATSGAAETSRIAIDNQYRSDLNALGQARLTARAAAQDSAADQLASAESAYFTASENAALQQAQMTLSQYNSDRDYSLSVAGLTGFLGSTPTLAYQDFLLDVSQAQSEQQAAINAVQTAAQAQSYEQALERWKTYGYVLQNDASILGVPAGTPTADESYRNASLALQQWKAGYWY